MEVVTETAAKKQKTTIEELKQKLKLIREGQKKEKETDEHKKQEKGQGCKETIAAPVLAAE